MKHAFFGIKYVLTTFVIALMFSVGAWAQTYPSKPIKLIVSFSAGGPNDVMARILAQRLTEQMGVAVIVENLAGGSGVTGTLAGARAAPDGYTLTFGTTSNFAVLPSFRKNLPYDPRTSFLPISQVSAGPFLLVVNAQIPAKNIQQFIEVAKKQPGVLNFGSPGIGTPHQLALELLKMRAGVDITHVPYPGTGRMMSDLLSGRVQLAFDVVGTFLPNIQSGTLRPLAMASRSRFPSLPDVPTMAEAGLPDIEVAVWNGVLAPLHTPKEVINRLSKEVQMAVTSPAMREAFDNLSFQGESSSTPEDFALHIDRELKKWGEVIAKAKIMLTD